MDVKFRRASCPITNERMPNETASFRDYHVSYARFLSHYGCDTTALVLEDRVFLILNGDHKAAMAEAASIGVNACLDYFIAHINESNALSEHRMIAGAPAADVFNLRATFEKVFGAAGVTRLQAAMGV